MSSIRPRTRALATALFAATCALSAASEARAGWVQAPGAYYLKIADRSLVGSKVYDLTGASVALPSSFQDHHLQLYGEYGLTEALTLTLEAAPIGLAKLGEETTAYVGPTWLGLRYALLAGDLPIAAELAYGYTPPLGPRPLATGTVGAETWLFRPTLEQHLVRGGLAAGWSTGPLWLRGAVDAVLSSGDDVDPALEAHLALGVRGPLGLAAALQGTLHAPTRAPRVIDVTGVGNTRYLGLDLNVSWWMTERVGLVLTIGAAINAASNAAAAPLGVGVEIRS